MFKIFEVATNGNITELPVGSTTTSKDAAHIQVDTDQGGIVCLEAEQGGINAAQATAIKAKAKSLLKDGIVQSAKQRGKAKPVQAFDGVNSGVKYIAVKYPVKGYNASNAAQAQSVKDAMAAVDTWLQANTVAAPAQPQQPAQPAQPAQPQQPAQPAQPAQPQGNQPAQPAQPQGNQPQQPAQQPAQPAQPQGNQPQGNQSQQPAQPTRTASHYTPWWEGIDPNDAEAMAAAARQFLNS